MSQVQEIKDRLDIAEVVGSYVDLQPAGKNLKGVCPFHNERTPSFFVSPDRGTYHCFGCDRGGDMFSFIQDIEGVDFVGALKVLAARAGIELVQKKPGERSDGKERLYDALEQATVYFQKQLVGNPAALSYLRGRGVLPETMKTFRLGFAPDSWEGLCTHLRGRGFSDEELERAGLAVPSKRGRGSFDRFRSRIMFPFTDPSGRIVGFSGRIFEKEGDDVAKYVNTPETELYHKSEVLFGFHHAKQDIRREGRVILVEGQMDLILSHQAGHKNTVAVSGTGLTEKHVTLLRRFCKELLIALDADNAGLSASDRAAVLAEAHEISVSAVAISGGKDPADMILEDSASWTAAVGAARGYIPFRLDTIRAEYERRGSEDEAASAVREAIFPHVHALYGGIRKDNALKLIAGTLGVSVEAAREEFESWQKKRAQAFLEPAKTGSQQEGGAQTSGELSRRDRIERKILGVFFWQTSAKEPKIDLEAYRERYRSLVGKERARREENIPASEREKMAFEAEMFSGGSDRITNTIDELFVNLEVEILTHELAGIGKALRAADPKSAEEADELVRRYQEFSRRREELRSGLSGTT